MALRARGAGRRKFDYLFIDEAGQVSLADALAVSPCAQERRAARRSVAARAGQSRASAAARRRLGAAASARRRADRSPSIAASSSTSRIACSPRSARSSRMRCTRVACDRRSRRESIASRRGKSRSGTATSSRSSTPATVPARRKKPSESCARSRSCAKERSSIRSRKLLPASRDRSKIATSSSSRRTTRSVV